VLTVRKAQTAVVDAKRTIGNAQVLSIVAVVFSVVAILIALVKR
jgi:hypothetical protein